MQYLLTRVEKDGSTPSTSNEWTSVHSTLESAMNKIRSTNNWSANIKFCAEGWRKTHNGRKACGNAYTVYEYNGED